ncbi:hypothetical protein YTPLAS18_36970 [Nitrospira sp.]|nr:hypothetical protein YTPLAS18_36970 [Nitrospira sp.]
MTGYASYGLVLALIGSAGCVSAEMQQARVVGNALVGLTRTELVTCAGEPQDVTQQNGRAVLVYYKGCGALEQGFPTTHTTMTRVPRHGCRAAVEVEDETIRLVEFVPIPAGADYEAYHCEEIFASCTR